MSLSLRQRTPSTTRWLISWCLSLDFEITNKNKKDVHTLLLPWHSSSSGQRDNCSQSAPGQHRGRTWRDRLSSETCRGGCSEILGSQHPEKAKDRKKYEIAEEWDSSFKQPIMWEIFVNLCYFSSAEVGKPLQWKGQYVRCSMDCEALGCWHFLLAPGEKKKRVIIGHPKRIWINVTGKNSIFNALQIYLKM